MSKPLIKRIFPERLVRWVALLKNNYMDGYSIKSYSQEGEDMILRRIFENQATGFYVDVGAHHPMRFSNTYFFYKRGWRGINIDAMPGSMKAFDRFRPDDINIETPVSSDTQKLVYFAFNEPALNGFSREISEKRNGLDGYQIIFTKEIVTSTLEEILDQHMPANKEIDFLSVDVEGMDYDVIKSINFEKYRPRVVLVEMLGFSIARSRGDPICETLMEQGYSLYAKAVNTAIFKSEGF